MAKSKKNIGAFQKAMLNNTKMIASEKSQTEKETKKIPTKTTTQKNSTTSLPIEPGIQTKLDAIADKYGIETNILISKSLDLFISLEDYWFNDK